MRIQGSIQYTNKKLRRRKTWQPPRFRDLVVDHADFLQELAFSNVFRQLSQGVVGGRELSKPPQPHKKVLTQCVLVPNEMRQRRK